MVSRLVALVERPLFSHVQAGPTAPCLVGSLQARVALADGLVHSSCPIKKRSDPRNRKNSSSTLTGRKKYLSFSGDTMPPPQAPP